MYNTDLPSRADLPTSAQLKRSTLIAALTALTLLVTVVMPSEYAIDPTGAGRLLGLTEMGEIKTQLAAEAAADETTGATAPWPPQNTVSADLLARMERIENLLVTMTVGQPALPSQAAEPVAQNDVTAGEIIPAQPVQAVPETAPQVAETPAVAPAQSTGRRDEMSFTLTPGQGIEVKLVMRQGAKANFAWTVDGGVVNFDTHGDGGGQNVSYEKGRSVPSGEGILEAAFDGNHGWFWRNRGDSDVTLTIQTEGDYIDIKRMI
ncbi:hypothetical protein NKH89_12140 [Mesorhizobium sp. M0923]|uniref:hypothetical protein n=1 Tax=unclassified Mesorhizobium TaxID=325217 RepID=UPI0003D01B1B|nr:hypothetical protein [Mesorhizobium sp. L48C026A00]ESZ11276.1 transmembrane anchor protein [Mesorhizobium sp. L48C026A00]